jgi:hypothetical protein
MSKKYRYEQLKNHVFETNSEGRITNNELLWKYRYPDEYVAVDVLWYDGDSGRVLCYDTKYKESGWQKPQDLYRRVEIEEPEQREPLECFVKVESKRFKDNVACLVWDHHPRYTPGSNGEWIKVREVIPPEKKELPDCEGWWQVDSPDNHPVNIRFSDSVPIGNLGSPVSKGRWIKLDDLIKQAWKDAE